MKQQEVKMIKAVFFDVDGTLVSHTRGEVSASTREAVSRLKAKGIRCVVATGRHMSELRKLPVKDIGFDAYITLNGQLCLGRDHTVISSSEITGVDKDRIIRLFEEKEIPIILVEKERMYINFVNREVEQTQKDISSDMPERREYTGGEIYQAIAYVGKGREDWLKNILPGSRITRWNDRAVDIISRNGGKVTGIKQYLKENHISAQESMAFGDGENDMEMLEFAGVGIAMGNAEDMVKKSADYVTDSVDNRGIENAFLQAFYLPFPCARNFSRAVQADWAISAAPMGKASSSTRKRALCQPGFSLPG